MQFSFFRRSKLFETLARVPWVSDECSARCPKFGASSSDVRRMLSRFFSRSVKLLTLLLSSDSVGAKNLLVVRDREAPLECLAVLSCAGETVFTDMRVGSPLLLFLCPK